MAESQPIPIRLPTETVARLDVAAKRLGFTRSGVIRFCVETWLRHFEQKGRAALPVDWDEVMANQDGAKASAARLALLTNAPRPNSEVKALRIARLSV